MHFILNTIHYVFSGLIISIIFLSIYKITLRIKKERICRFEKFMFILFSIYLTTVFSATVSPVYGFSIIPNIRSINVVPFRVLQSAAGNPLNFLGNIVMFVPFGCILVLVSKKCRKFHVVLFAGAALSLLIELLQLFELRATDIDDILLNTAGTCIGYCIGKTLLLFSPYMQSRTDRITAQKSNVGILLILSLLMLINVFAIGFSERAFYSSKTASANKTLPPTISIRSFKCYTDS